MKHLYLATPHYDHSVSVGYCQSLAMTVAACTRAGICLSGPDFKGGPYIECNRNWLAHRFLGSGADAVLFIDADVTWDERAVIALYESGKELIGGVYPYKQDEEGYPVKIAKGRHGELIEANYLPGGFMLARREVFVALHDHVTQYIDPSFSNELVEVFFENRYTQYGFCGEDVEFCNKWRRLGNKVWALPDIDFEHTGPKSWVGNYARFLDSQLVAEANLRAA